MQPSPAKCTIACIYVTINKQRAVIEAKTGEKQLLFRKMNRRISIPAKSAHFPRFSPAKYEKTTPISYQDWRDSVEKAANFDTM